MAAEGLIGTSEELIKEVVIKTNYEYLTMGVTDMISHWSHHGSIINLDLFNSLGRGIYEIANMGMGILVNFVHVDELLTRRPMPQPTHP